MLYKRKKNGKAVRNWTCEVTVNGKKIQKSTKTEDRKFAKAFEQKLIADLWSAQQLKVVKRSLSDCINRYIAERPGSKRDHSILSKLPKTDRVIGDIAKEDIREYLDAVASEASGSTANRTRNTLRALFNAAHEWGWINSVPLFPTYKANQFEPMWITQAQFKAVLAELPQHAQVFARFAACTGLRYSNIARFKWIWINGDVAYIPASETKAGNTIPVVLSDEAKAILEGQKGKHSVYAFTDDHGRAPVGSIKTCWREAVKRANLVGLRFHDLRHSWASWHLQQGTPLHVVQKLGGWKSYNMLLERYGHFSTSDMQQYANKLKTGEQ